MSALGEGVLLSRQLWDRNQDLARLCLNHRFVQGLGDGSLDADAFKRYVAQDAFFLRAFARAYALGAAKSEDVADIREFHALMDGALDELSLHESYALDLGIDLDAVDPYPETRSYTDFLLRTAWASDVAELLAATTPCMRLYAYLGQRLSAHGAPENPYANWIATYSSSGFEDLATRIEALLDAVGDDVPRLQNVYRTALECELSFFSAPLEDRGA